MSNHNTTHAGAQPPTTGNATAASNTPRLSTEQWNELQSQIKQHWGQVSEEALLETKGDLTKLTALLQQQTQESRQTIEQTLRQLIDREPESEGSTGAGSRSQ